MCISKELLIDDTILLQILGKKHSVIDAACLDDPIHHDHYLCSGQQPTTSTNKLIRTGSVGEILYETAESI